MATIMDSDVNPFSLLMQISRIIEKRIGPCVNSRKIAAK